MFGDISRAIAEAIRTNHAALLSIIGTICGTVFGATVTFVFERIRDSGNIKPSLLDAVWSIELVGIQDKKQNFSGSIPGVRFQFHFLVLNSYPIPKTIFIKDAVFLPSAPKWWSKPQPLPITAAPISAGKSFNQQEMDTDIQCEAHSFTQLWITGHGHVDKDYGRAKAVLCQAAGIQVQLLITPKKEMSFWYPLPKENLNKAVAAWEPTKPLIH